MADFGGIDGGEGIEAGADLRKLMTPPVILVALFGQRRVTVSLARNRSELPKWRFQFGNGGVLHMRDDGWWAWHVVTRETRRAIEPLVQEAIGIADALAREQR